MDELVRSSGTGSKQAPQPHMMTHPKQCAGVCYGGAGVVLVRTGAQTGCRSAGEEASP